MPFKGLLKAPAGSDRRPPWAPLDRSLEPIGESEKSNKSETLLSDFLLVRQSVAFFVLFF